MIENEMRLASNVGRDADVKMSKAGKRIVTFSMAYTKKSRGEFPDLTTWYSIVVFENDNAYSKYLVDEASLIKKGMNVYVSGELHQKSFTGRDGTEKISLEITADKLAILSKPSKPSVSFGDSEIGDIPF